MSPTSLEVDQLAQTQAGAISRGQALELGMTKDRINHLLKTGRWQRVHPGVYLVFSGSFGYLTRAWAALLYVGQGAALGLETAEYFWAMRDEPPLSVHVMVPADRRVDPQAGLRIHIRRALPHRVHPMRKPAITLIEDTVLDLIEHAATVQEVIGLLTRSCQRRLTTASRLAAAMTRRKKMRWRQLVGAVLEDVTDGALSALERGWRRDVELAHGLPGGVRNRPEDTTGERRYRDVRYLKLRIVVELDGRAAHPDELRHRDMRRDNELAERGEVTLRYGWLDVASYACEAAAQFIRVARLRGWQGTPKACGPRCSLVGTSLLGDHETSVAL